MYDLFMAFLGVLFRSCYCHDIAWSSRTNILQLMRMTCYHWIISGPGYDYFHAGIWYYILEYYFGCHVAFRLLVAFMIIFIVLLDMIF